MLSFKYNYVCQLIIVVQHLSFNTSTKVNSYEGGLYVCKIKDNFETFKSKSSVYFTT